MNLKEVIIKAIDYDEESILYLLKMFNPKISFCARKLDYYGAETDLIIEFIEAIPKLRSCTNPKFSEGEIINYIAKLINNKAIDLFRKNIKEIKLNEKIVDFNIDLISITNTDDLILNKILVKEMLSVLTNKQREVIESKYLLNNSVDYISSNLKISRQSVHRLEQRALVKLRTEFQKGVRM